MESYQNDSTSSTKSGQDESLNGAGTSTSINMEQLNSMENKDSFLNRQFSTPEQQQQTTNRLQQMHQSRSVGAPRINMNVMGESSSSAPLGPSAQSGPLTAPILNPNAVRQFGFWRDVFSLSTAPSKEALRSLIENSNLRYQPIGDNAVSQHPLSLNDPAGSTSGPISMRMSVNNDNSGGMDKTNSLREGELMPTSDNKKQNTESLNMQMSSNNPFTSTDAAPSPNGSGNGNGSNSHVREDNPRDQMVLNMLSYLPISLILLVKFVYVHWEGILDLLLLQIAFHILNRTLTEEVARGEQKRYSALIFGVIMGSLVTTLRLYIATDQPDPFGLIIPPPKTYSTDGLPHNRSFLDHLSTLDEDVPENKLLATPVGLLFYYAAVSDLIIRMITILIKFGITLLPMHEMQMRFRARLLALLENICQCYRMLTPITQWVVVFTEDYSDKPTVSYIQLLMYLLVKIIELQIRYRSLKNAITIFKTNSDSKQRTPTQDELVAADSMCPICNDPYNSPIILECNHIFCAICIQRWFRREQTCPMCRAKVSDDPTWQNGSTTSHYQLY